VRLVLIGALVASAALLAAGEGRARPPLAVTLTVVGQGAVHVRLAEGQVAPCDSTSDRPLLDRWLQPGTSLALSVSSACVCVEHTYGSFPGEEWSPGRVLCGEAPSRRNPRPDPVLRIVLSSDAP